jgi:hypothetical protein
MAGKILALSALALLFSADVGVRAQSSSTHLCRHLS